MILKVIQVADSNSPIEVQNWLADNPSITISAAWNDGAIFYIFYS